MCEVQTNQEDSPKTPSKSAERVRFYRNIYGKY